MVASGKIHSNEYLPSDPVPVVRLNPQTRQRELVQLRWGLVPSRPDDPAKGTRLLNARSETVATRPTFREAFRLRRCLLVVDSFDIGKGRGG